MIRRMKKHMAIIMTITFVLGFILMPPIMAIAEGSVDISGDFTDANLKKEIWMWLGNSYNSTPGSFSKQDLINRMPETEYSIDVSYGQIIYNTYQS